MRSWLLVATLSIMAALPQRRPPGAFAPLPDNPCDVLTAAEMSRAAGVRVTRVERRPSIRQEVEAQQQRRDPEPGVICSYQTDSEYVSIAVSLQKKQDRSRDAYWLCRAHYFETWRGSASYVAGLGADAWVSGGTTIDVLIRDDEYFGIMTQMYTPQSRDVVIQVARAILAKLAR